METVKKLAVLVSALALFVISAVPAAATGEGHGYLALGDSVAFGANPLLDRSVASNFIGYPETVAQTLNIVRRQRRLPG